LLGGEDEEKSEQGACENEGGLSPERWHLQEAVGKSGTQSREMNFRTRHGGGVGGADDVFGPVTVRTDENDFIFEHLPIFKNPFPSGRDEELIDGNGFVVEVWGASEAEESRATSGNAIVVACFFEHAACEGDGGDGLEMAMIIGAANDAVAIGPQIYKAHTACGIFLRDFRRSQRSEGGGEGELDGGAACVTDFLKSAAKNGTVTLVGHGLEEFLVTLFGSGKH